MAKENHPYSFTMAKKQIIIIDSSWQRSCLPMAISWDKNANKKLNKKQNKARSR